MKCCPRLVCAPRLLLPNVGGAATSVIFQTASPRVAAVTAIRSSAKVRMGAKRSKAGTVSRVEQHDAGVTDAAQRADVGENRETLGFQRGD